MSLFDIFKTPSDCYLCGCSVEQPQNVNQSRLEPLLCHYCHKHLPLAGVSCHICGLPFSIDTINSLDQVSIKKQVPCGKCLKHSPHYDRTISGFHYAPPVSDFITQLKYSAQFQLLPLLSGYLASNIQSSYDVNQYPKLIIAVPLHPKKLTQRGFNQSQLIANHLSKVLNIKTHFDGITRIKATQAQSGLDSIERINNVQNAFQISHLLPEHIAIVDDVVTTGTTVSELSKQARLHGAKKIDIWCLARAYEI